MELDRLGKKSEKDSSRVNMTLPSPKELGDALRRWREDRGLTEMAVAKFSQRRSSRKFGALQVGRWENGKQSFTYKRLVADILPAYQITDFDSFLDYCRIPSIEDVTVIKAEQFTPGRISDGVSVYFVAKAFLEKGQHRNRIDRLVFAPGKNNRTTWGAHNGHEFVLILEGAVDCEFGMDEEVIAATKLTLKKDMAVVFPSSLYHRFGNASDQERAVLVVAKPTSGRTAAKD